MGSQHTPLDNWISNGSMFIENLSRWHLWRQYNVTLLHIEINDMFVSYLLFYNIGYCMNIGEYCPEQYIILRERASAIWYTAKDNIHAITLLLYSNKYFFFWSVINTVKIWFFHISLLYCTRKNILIFALVQ